MPLVARPDPVGAASVPQVPDLRATDPATRRRAAQALADAQALALHLGAEADESVRATILTRLAGMASPEAALALIPHLRSQDAALRNGVIAALRLMPKAAASIVPEVLADPDPDIRLFGVNIVETLTHPDAGDWLCALLGRETVENVAGAAMDALAECGGADAIPAIAEARARFADCAFIAFAADFACERLRGPA